MAQQLVRSGHDVVVFEKDASPGGMLRYGIPDFKLEKRVIDRRLSQMEEEGVDFQNEVKAGVDISTRYLEKMFDCVCLTMGARKARDLKVQGRELKNIYFAMDFLSLQNRIVAGEKVSPDDLIGIKDKNVVVIGGGDTGSDCVGTSRRLGAKNIYQLEILPEPPETRPSDTPWPNWPRIMRTSSSHEEGCERIWSVLTKSFEGDGSGVKKLNCCKVDWENVNGKWELTERAGSEFTIDAEVVLLAMGFEHVVHDGLVNELGASVDDRGNLIVDNYRTTNPNVFGAGDSILGASLVVRAIHTGREAAVAVDHALRS
jgi:NADPH-dependent glutamate synthase beta subunit-like oxidoreductase